MTDKKKMTPLMICHLILMVIFALGCLVAGVLIIASASNSTLMGYEISPAIIIVFGLSILSNAAALCCGILYLIKNYTKQAAPFYKGFLLLTAVACAIGIAMCVIAPRFSLDESDQTTSILRIATLLSLSVKCILILVLTFAPNLGKRNTWILFCIMLGIDLVFGFFGQAPGSISGVRLTAVLSRLLMTGTIGLAIKGKYDDKDARGTA